jgi:hypothetical protein
MKKRLFGLTLGLVIVAGMLIGSVLTKQKRGESGDINYAMTWDWGTATPTDTGWQVTNDLGYMIAVEKGYLVSHSIQLLECNDSDESAGLIGDFFEANTAEANHGGDDNDPSAILIPLVEELGSASSSDFGAVNVPYRQYCTAHYLVARSDSVTRNMPDDIDMYGQSLYLEGTYQVVDSEAVVPFTLQTSLANGTIADIRLSTNTEPMRVEISDEVIHIDIQRQLDTLFDGVDFETMDADEQARTVLWSLIRDTRVLVTSGKVDG